MNVPGRKFMRGSLTCVLNVLSVLTLGLLVAAGCGGGSAVHPIAVWMANGDSDAVVPLADGKIALDLFVKRAACSAQTMPVSPSPCVAYQGCMADDPITFCQWSGGHGVPSFASQAIWAFFDQF